jgi:Rho termination factor, N-terminal domain
MKKLIVGIALALLAAVLVSRTRGPTGIARRAQRLGRAVKQRIGGSERELAELPKDELYEQAKERDIPGRSAMTKDELIDALENED